MKATLVTLHLGDKDHIKHVAAAKDMGLDSTAITSIAIFFTLYTAYSIHFKGIECVCKTQKKTGKIWKSQIKTPKPTLKNKIKMVLMYCIGAYSIHTKNSPFNYKTFTHPMYLK